MWLWNWKDHKYYLGDKIKPSCYYDSNVANLTKSMWLINPESDDKSITLAAEAAASPHRA